MRRRLVVDHQLLEPLDNVIEENRESCLSFGWVPALVGVDE